MCAAPSTMIFIAEPNRDDARMLGVDLRGALNLVGSLFRYLSLAFLLPAAIALGYGRAPKTAISSQISDTTT